MIINGGSRCNGAFFARHLMRVDENERVTVADMRGFSHAEDVPSAFNELHDMAKGTRAKNWFYHANMNTAADERLTPEQWAMATDRLESELQLTGQPRFIVEHQKEGRVHRHIVWGRIDADTMTTIHDGHNYRRHEDAARDIEAAFDLSPVERCLTRDKEKTPRQERRPADWESFRAAESKIDPQAMKVELTDLWQRSDSGAAFAAAIEERGYILAKGDRRDFCIVDAAGDEHSLSRRLAGVKAAEVRSRMEGIDREALPSVEEARTLARARPEEGGTSQPAEMPQAQPESVAQAELSPFEAAMQETAQRAQGRLASITSEAQPVEQTPFALAMQETAGRAQRRPYRAPREAEEPLIGASPAYAAAMAETIRQATREAAADQATGPEAEAGRWERFTAWLGTVRESVAGWGENIQAYWRERFGYAAEPEAQADPAAPESTPGTVVTGPNLTAEKMQERGQGMEPGL